MNRKMKYEEMSRKDLKSLDKIVLYHGTSDLFIKDIRKRGLLPWNMLSSGHNWQIDSDMFGVYTPRIDCVYFALKDRATSYAEYKAESTEDNPILVKVCLDTKRLMPDEDSRRRTWYDSLKSIGCCSYAGKIDTSMILGIYTLPVGDSPELDYAHKVA